MTYRIYIILTVTQCNVLVYKHSKFWLCRIWCTHSAAAGILLFWKYN